MRRVVAPSILPVVAGLAAFFAVLPHTGGDVTIRMVREAGAWGYDPDTLRVKGGARIAFRNDTTRTHTATCEACPWDTGDVQPGETRFITLTEEGAYPFSCRYHGPEMSGVLGVDAEPVRPTPAPLPSPAPPGLPVPGPPGPP